MNLGLSCCVGCSAPGICTPPFRPGLIATAILWMSTVASAQGFPPDEAPRRMTVPDGLQVQLVAAEPLVRQPVAIEFDDRGRLWVIQYLQYPNPAGLKRVEWDRFSRTKYDRVPEPPPRGPRGADRITILEDSDGDGRLDRGRDFVSGLNLTTGLAFGHGGVFVLNVPYLLFYPDRNRDDVPDGDPEVLLSGFGMEDAHSVANSLTFGPDGWLYGCQGSTVTAQIRGIEFQQGVWRYHPVTRAFELFCEGGGNSWGLDFDARGDLLYSTNFGGYVLLHGVQGGYYWKQFGKHGALHNPYAYGYFDHAPHADFRGGHVTAGGVVYQADLLPPAFRGKYIGADLLGHGVNWHHLQPRGSTWSTAHGGELLRGNDTWFAPCDVTIGPDGAVYVADWCDARTAHPDPDAEWDRSNGRIYRIAPINAPHAADVDYAQLGLPDVLQRLRHPQQWHVRRARQELVRRRDPAALPPLRAQLKSAANETEALAALWSLLSLDAATEDELRDQLSSPFAAVRAWAVRRLGDQHSISPATGRRLVDLAQAEPEVRVRLQLAATARRLTAAQGMPIVQQLCRRDLDHADPFIPLMLWWAVERHCVASRDLAAALFAEADVWKSQLARDAVLPRLVRRYAAEGTDAGMSNCLELLHRAPSAADRAAVLLAFTQGWQERAAEPRSRGPGTPQGDLAREVLLLWKAQPDDLARLRAAAGTFGWTEARDYAWRRAHQPDTPAETRAAFIDLVARTLARPDQDVLLKVVTANEPEAVRQAAVRALAPDDHFAPLLLDAYPHLPARVKGTVREQLLAHPLKARELLAAVRAGQVPPADFTVDEVRRFGLHHDAEIDGAVRQVWGKFEAATPEEKLAEVRRLNNDLRAAAGDVVAGRELFRKHCGACHKLFGDGGAVGPDLTTANRSDRNFLLVSLVDPSASIRKEYQVHVVATQQGQVFSGILVEQSAAGVTLVDAQAKRQSIARADIAEIAESAASLMPEKLLEKLSPQELRDLFAYLQRPAP